MFGGKKTTNEEVRKPGMENAPSIVAAGGVIIGDVHSDGDIRIEGHIIGTLVCKSKLIIGKTGKVDGNIDSRNANIAGEVNGTIIVREILQLNDTARVTGDIITEQMVTHLGHIHTGSTIMGPRAKEALKNAPIPTLQLPNGINVTGNHKQVESHDERKNRLKEGASA